MLTFFSCLGENSWEDLESEYDHVLNVFGLVSLDSLQPSYIGLYSTTDLDEISQIFVGVDTLGWCDCDDDECGWNEDCDTKEIEGYWILDSLFEPAALIKNASVMITDENGNKIDVEDLQNTAKENIENQINTYEQNQEAIENLGGLITKKRSLNSEISACNSLLGDCEEQLREWAKELVDREIRRRPEGKMLKQLEDVKTKALDTVMESGSSETLIKALELCTKKIGITWVVDTSQIKQIANN